MSEFGIQRIQSAVESGDAEAIMGRGLEMRGAREASAPGGGTFSDALRSAVDQVNTHQAQADHAIKELVAGRNKNLHETMLAVERADASLKLMMQVRNKVIDAYKEIMRMQV